MNKFKPVIVIISWILVVATMVTIAFFSLQNGKESTQTSNKVTEVIIPNEDNVSYEGMKALTTITRKTAHFCIYMLLGLLVFSAFYFFRTGTNRTLHHGSGTARHLSART